VTYKLHRNPIQILRLKQDDPPRKPLEEEPQWEEDLKRYVNFQKILETDDVSIKVCEQAPQVPAQHHGSNPHLFQKACIVETCNTAIHLLHTASPNAESSLNIPFLSKFFEDRHNDNVFLFSSNLYSVAGSEEQMPASTEEERQAAAKLHSYYGTSKEAIGRTRSRAAHPFARAKVYDLRGYTDNNLWGPFMDDGSLRTDWEKVESLMIVLGYNLQLFGERCRSPAIKSLMVWHQAFEGVTPGSYTPMSSIMDMVDKSLRMELEFLQGCCMIVEPEPPLEAMDPYGVSGTWRRVSSSPPAYQAILNCN
jgi:hypothetical protein